MSYTPRFQRCLLHMLREAAVSIAIREGIALQRRVDMFGHAHVIATYVAVCRHYYYLRAGLRCQAALLLLRRLLPLMPC